ncbi:uncharacterized protein [Diadema setosum]|uniref:uncharacterized protein n=1 Tax=Diadema setosum TaxID=31175 RepID=UPI003B3B013C
MNDKPQKIQRPPSYASNAFEATEEEKDSRGISVRTTGILHVVLGLTMVVIGIVAAFLQCYLSYYIVPVWSGLLFFSSTGIVGIKTFHSKMSKGMVISYLVMCVCAAITAGAMFVMYILVTLHESYSIYCYSQDTCYRMRVRVLINMMIIVLSFLEVVVAITGSGLACCRTCPTPCCRTAQPSSVNMVYYNNPAEENKSCPQYEGNQACPQFISSGSLHGQPMMIQGGGSPFSYAQGPTELSTMTTRVVQGTGPTSSTSQNSSSTVDETEKKTSEVMFVQ